MIQNNNSYYNTISNIFYFTSTISFFCSLIFTFYTVLSNGSTFGVFMSFLICPLLCLPQWLLWILSSLKKDTLFICVARVFLVLAGFFTTMMTFLIANCKVNILGMLNILLLSAQLPKFHAVRSSSRYYVFFLALFCGILHIILSIFS